MLGLSATDASMYAMDFLMQDLEIPDLASRFLLYSCCP